VKTAYDARSACQSIGASLLMLNTEEIYEWYQTVVAEEPCEYTTSILF